MDSLTIIPCITSAMAIGFLIGSFYKRESARIDADHWKRMYEMERDYWEGSRMPPPLPESEADRMSAS